MEIINNFRREEPVREHLTLSHDDDIDEYNFPEGSMISWTREIKQEGRQVYCKVIVDQNNLPLEQHPRSEIARCLREAADIIEHDKPTRDVGPGGAIWIRDTRGRKLAWLTFEEA